MDLDLEKYHVKLSKLSENSAPLLEKWPDDRIYERTKQFIKILHDFIMILKNKINLLKDEKNGLSVCYEKSDLTTSELTFKLWKNIVYHAVGQDLRDKLEIINYKISKLHDENKEYESEMENENLEYDDENRCYENSTNNGEYTDDETIHNKVIYDLSVSIKKCNAYIAIETENREQLLKEIADFPMDQISIKKRIEEGYNEKIYEIEQNIDIYEKNIIKYNEYLELLLKDYPSADLIRSILKSLCYEKNTYIQQYVHTIFQDRSIRFFGTKGDFIPLIDNSDESTRTYVKPEKMLKKMRNLLKIIDLIKGDCAYDIIRVDTWKNQDIARHMYADILIADINRYEQIMISEIEGKLVEIESCLDRFDDEMIRYTEGIIYDDYSGPERRLIYDNNNMFIKLIKKLLEDTICISYLEGNKTKLQRDLNYSGLL